MRLLSPALIPAFLVAAGVLPHSLIAQEVVGRNDEVFTTSKMVGSGGTVRIYSMAGDVTITEGTDGRVSYRGEKLLRRGRVDDVGFVVLSGENGVTICAVYDDDDECTERGIRGARRRGGSWGGRASVRVSVEVPRGVLLRTSSGNGDVRVSAAVRELDATSGNGDVTISRAAGPVRASSGNGDVSIATTNGPVTASTGNGDVDVQMDEAPAAGDMEFSSGNGRIVLNVPRDFDAEITASTGNGSIRTELPIRLQGSISPQRMNGTLGSGGRRVRLSSGNGSIEIRSRG
ncbi:MAG: DUF4097 domain-containing protein [Gemmatimonadaceae bacterium]|jgi:hypothetical protein|nr:DUF4097 domain-containing protein [Gemmatimonadaceae bacterium]